MREINAFFTAIKDIERPHWRTATWSLLFAIIFGLLPTWVTMIMLKIFSIDISFKNLVDDGQFAIYSAAFIATGLYFVAREFNTSKFKGRSGFILSLCGLIILASLLVGGVSIAGEVNLPIDRIFIRYVSIAVFCLTVPIYFICAARNEAGIAGDYNEIRQKQLKELEDKFTPPGGEKDEK